MRNSFFNCCWIVHGGINCWSWSCICFCYQVSLVINYDLPNNRELYIHRIGRSGRFGRKVLGVSKLIELMFICWFLSAGCWLLYVSYNLAESWFAGCCNKFCEEWWHQDLERHWTILQYSDWWNANECCWSYINCHLVCLMKWVCHILW